jgi:hypothetical protein
VVEQNRHLFLALVVQAKQEAATGHTYSADNENIKKKKIESFYYFYCYFSGKETSFLCTINGHPRMRPKL